MKKKHKYKLPDDPEKLVQPIYWTGRQWAVTGYGMECLEERWANIHYGGVHDPYLLRHWSAKRWVDVEDFEAAHAVAKKIFEPTPHFARLIAQQQTSDDP